MLHLKSFVLIQLGLSKTNLGSTVFLEIFYSLKNIYMLMYVSFIRIISESIVGTEYGIVEAFVVLLASLEFYDLEVL